MKWYILVFLCRVCVIQCHSISVSEIEDFNNFLKETSRLDQNVKSISPDDYDEDELISDHAWEESGKFEGDLILNDRQRRLIVADVAEGLARNGLTDTTKRWPNNEVIYFIQREHFTSDQVQAIQDGIDDLARASCVKFSPYKKGDRDAVVIQGSRRGCFSQVGYQGGYQVLNLSGRHPVGRGCFRHGTVVHELLHTLGFYHMQSSPDRDEYIEVAWENIIKPARHNFRKYNSFSVSDFGVGYDYDSVLHYSRKAFSANGQDTLIPKQGGADIGQRIGLSEKDTRKLNKMYCDVDSDIADENDETGNKPVPKKKAKNKPFQGHGIGYQQGKTVVIKLPAAEVYKLQDSPQIQLFDYFSSTKKTMPTAPIEGFRTGQEINYDFVEANLANENNMKPIPTTIERPQEQYFPRESPVIKYNQMTSDEDDDLRQTFNRFAKVIESQKHPKKIKTYNYEASGDEKLRADDGSENVFYKGSEIVNPQFNLKTNNYYALPQTENFKEKELNDDEINYPKYQLIHHSEPSSVNKHNANVNTEISTYISPFLVTPSNNERDINGEKGEGKSQNIQIHNENFQVYPEILPIRNYESHVKDKLKEDDDLKEAFFRLSKIIKPKPQTDLLSNYDYYQSPEEKKVTEAELNHEELIYPGYKFTEQLKTTEDKQNINEQNPGYFSPFLVKQNLNEQNKDGRQLKDKTHSDIRTDILPGYYYKDYNDPNEQSGERKQIIFDEYFPQHAGDTRHKNLYYDDTTKEYQQNGQNDAHQHNHSKIQDNPFSEQWISSTEPITHSRYQNDQLNHEFLIKNSKLAENYR